ncbi:MAG: Rpn family recombination-promoting nuclease/putative transposase [Desulfohalobiaceae bacterium]
MARKEYTPHESLFLKVFKDKENTKHFLQQHLAQDLLEHADWDSMYLENVSYLDDEMRKHFSDLVFSVRMGQQEFSAAKVYLLFEHKSSPESLVGLQVLRYMALQWKEMYDQGQIAGGKLPPIIPIVIYQGRGSWKARASFQELVELPSETYKAFVPDFSFAFFNVGEMEERKVQQNVVLKFYVAIIKSLDKPELKEMLPQLTRGLYESLGHKTASEYLEIFLRYLTRSTDILDRQDYEKALAMLPEGGRDIMNTLAEQWMKEGYEKAEQEYMQAKGKWISEGEQNMLIEAVQERFGTVQPALVSKVRSISSTEILRGLFRQVFKLDSLEAFNREVDKALK